jgi:acetyl-CoA carboxylase biotin carboxyl carrier protein
MVRERADRNGGSASVSTATSLSVAELRQLISLMEHSDIEEITIEHEADGLHLTLRKPTPATLDPAAIAAMAALAEPVDGATSLALEPAPGVDDTAGALEIQSTLVGFYRAVAKRGAKALAPGDNVKEGQIIGAVEALNVLNEIESPATGKVKKILVDDGEAVQYGQVLMLVEPRSA